MEACKLVLWPREPMVDQSGKNVYRYAICGMIATDKPIDWPNESVVVSGTSMFDSPITEILDRLPKADPPYPLGDASSAMLTVCEIVPEDL